MDKCIFEIFGISFKHFADWKIVPEQAMDFTFDRGFIRFEENGSKGNSEISLGIRWERMNTDNESFIRSFSEKIKGECRKKLNNKKDDFKIISEDIIEGYAGQKMCCMVTQFRATQGLVKIDKKMKALRIINTAYYCENTKRIIICSLISTPSKIENEMDELLDILKSIQSKQVFSPETEAARDKIYQEKREKAAMSVQKNFFTVFKQKKY